MKNDINFIDCLKQGEKKKSSGATNAFLIIGVVAIFAVMIYMYVFLEKTYKDNADLMISLEAEKTSSKYAKNEQAYIAAQKKYAEYLKVTSSKEGLVDYISNYDEISRQIMDSLFNTTLDNNGLETILINEFYCSGQSVKLKCKSSSFVLIGNLEELLAQRDAFINRLKNAKITTVDGDLNIIVGTPSCSSLTWDDTSEVGKLAISFDVTITLIDISALKEN